MKVTPKAEVPGEAGWDGIPDRRRRVATQDRRWRAAVLVSLLVGFALGFGLRRDQAGAVAGGRARCTETSFSEVDPLKESLRELRLRHVLALRTPPEDKRSLGLRTDPEALRRVEELLTEFAGTEDERELTRVQLTMLWRAGKLDQWLNRYLAVAYGHPTWRMLNGEWDRAAEVARELGREEEMTRVLAYLGEIPRELVTLTPRHPARRRANVAE